MPLIAPPVINGNYFDFSSIGFYVGATKITGLKSINYTSEQSPGDVYGTSSQKLGRTRGMHKSSGSFEIYRPEFKDLQIALQGGTVFLQTVATGVGIPGTFESSFLIQVCFSENPPLGINVGGFVNQVQTDNIIGARITKIDQGHSQGGDPLTVKCDFDAMYILYNDASPINALMQAGNALQV